MMRTWIRKYIMIKKQLGTAKYQKDMENYPRSKERLSNNVEKWATKHKENKRAI